MVDHAESQTNSVDNKSNETALQRNETGTVNRFVKSQSSTVGSEANELSAW